MPPTQEEDLDATIEQLRAQIAHAPAEMRPLVEDQIRNLEGARAMLQAARPAMEENRRHRPTVPAALRPFFTPESPAQMPSWLPDDLQHHQFDIWGSGSPDGALRPKPQAGEAMLRCPPEARVYRYDDGFGCAIPQGPGAIPDRHGLSISFFHGGHLRAQSFYDRGCLRWAISWHASGGREYLGYYTDAAPREHREHGTHTRFAPNGTVISQVAFHHGVRHGWTKLWEDDGYPAGATLYEQGQLVEEVLPNGERRRR